MPYMFVEDYSDFKISEEESILKHKLKLKETSYYGSILSKDRNQLP